MENDLAGGEKSHNCLEGDVYPPADNYFNLQNIYSFCLEGDELAFQKGYVPWNKGKKTGLIPANKPLYPPIPTLCLCGCGEVVWGYNKYVYGHQLIGKPKSDETKQKIARTKIGSNNGMYGKTPWNKGKKWSPDIIKKISAHTIEGLKNPDARKRLSASRRGQRNSPTTEFKKGNAPWFADDIRKNPMYGRTGENHPGWKGGSSFEPYCYKFNEKLKERIRERDNRTCQLCEGKENGRKLAVHHIHYDKKNCQPDLIALCIKCNSKVNHNRGYYENFFMEKLKARGLIT